MGGADEFRGAAELGAHPSRRDLRHRLAAPHQRPCISLQTSAGFDRHRLASQHGLVKQDFPAGETHIRGHYAAEGKLHNVAWRQLGRRYGFPYAVAPNARIQSEPRLQRRKGRLGAALLDQSERCIEYEETGNNPSLDIFAKRQLQHDRALEHPGNGRPEFLKGHAPRVRCRIGHRIETELFQPAARFLARKADLRTDIGDACRVDRGSVCRGMQNRHVRP